MESNVFDKATDILKERINLGKGVLRERFKNTKPYRKEPMTRDEKIYYANQITPEIETALRNNMGDDIFENYINKLRG